MNAALHAAGRAALGAILSAAVGGACAQAAAPAALPAASANPAYLGWRLFQVHCVRCHGADAAGCGAAWVSR